MRASPPPNGSLHRFDLPAGFLRDEQRLAGRALKAWHLNQRAALPGFEQHSLTIADPGGRAIVLVVAQDISTAFQIIVGRSLNDSSLSGGNGAGRDLAAELRAACDLVALGGRPIPFEASLGDPKDGMTLVRGIVLPLIGPTHEVDRVQAVLSWRGVLHRSAAERLRRELGDALRAVATSRGPRRDAFPVHPSNTPML